MAPPSRPSVYSGSEPYLFVSYGRPDSEAVVAEIARLTELGYRIWYDEGITPTIDWSDDVAHALSRCALFLVFLSPNAVNTANVLNEIHFVIKRGKTFLAVYLRDVELSGGLELLVDRFQAIKKFQLPEEVYRQKLEEILPARTRGAPPVEVAIRAHYFAVQREVIARHSGQCVGRGDVAEALNGFMATHHRGYFMIRGRPYMGKTAVACLMIQERKCPHHLIDPTGGRDDLRLILRSLLAQLRAPAIPDTVPELTKAFEEALVRTTAAGKPVVVVIDGLDELPMGAELPFLGADSPPEGAYIVITSRPGDRLDRLYWRLYGVPCEIYDLPPLSRDHATQVLLAKVPNMSPAEQEDSLLKSRGIPGYLHDEAKQAAANSERGWRSALLSTDPGEMAGPRPTIQPFFPRTADGDSRQETTWARDAVMSSLEGYFRRETAKLKMVPGAVVRDVVGLLSVARRPLTLRDLAQIIGQPMRITSEEGVRPIQHFLTGALDKGLELRDDQFRAFVLRTMLYEDELPEFHRKIIDWLRRPEGQQSAYGQECLPHHLNAAGP